MRTFYKTCVGIICLWYDKIMKTLIIGGTSGLGLSLARKLRDQDHEVIIVGRKDPDEHGLKFMQFDLEKGPVLAEAVDNFVAELPTIDALYYTAGFYQEGRVTELSVSDIKRMLDVGVMGAIWFIRELLSKQGVLRKFVVITSTSQTIPRELEPVYCATKAALGQFANAISLDKRVGQTLVVGPGGMKTEFWRMTKRDKSKDNDPDWVAGQILEALTVEFTYAYIKVLRDPPRTEIIETRS